MDQASTIGLDIAKHVFQVHGADAAGHVLFRKRLTRAKLIGFLAAQAPCVVAMEACAGAHYWAREIGSQAEDAGHRGSGQQDGPYRLGSAGQRRCLQDSGRGRLG